MFSIAGGVLLRLLAGGLFVLGFWLGALDAAQDMARAAGYGL